MISDIVLDMAPKTLALEPRPGEAAAQNSSGVTEVIGVTTSNGAASSVTPDGGTQVTAVTEIPDSSERPCYRVFDDFVEGEGNRYRPGVWYFAMRDGADAAVSVESWICGPLYIEAVTRDEQSNNFGRQLRFKPTIGPWRTWSMPMDLLAGDGREIRAELLSMGLEIDPRTKSSLALYLQSVTPTTIMRCATQVGWLEQSFVLPDAVIGPEAAGVVFQSPEPQADEFSTKGCLHGWRESVAALAPGNPLLVLALSAGFAGPLLKLCHAESGGLHLTGDSSTGKTAAIEAACSIWGGPGYKRSWRATSNGMEGAAALFNDGLLALDEISECDPRDVGAIIYSLGNGQGKQRASRTGAARSVKRWRCLVLSNGERTIETAMLEGGHRAKAGQGVRLLDIPASRTHGAWDYLHGHSSGAAYSDALKTAAAAHHGQAGREFLDRLTRDGRDMSARLERVKALPGFTVEDGQHKRGAARLALISLAGELATEYGITGWPEGEAIAAAQDALKCWQELRGAGPSEKRQVLAQVSTFIDRHGDGRFSGAGTPENATLRDRAGWWRDGGGKRLYLFNGDGMRQALKSFDFKRGLDHLQQAGALVDCGNSRRSKAHRINGRIVRLYSIDPDQLGVNDGS
jgi:putative DNA primase/helicase